MTKMATYSRYAWRTFLAITAKGQTAEVEDDPIKYGRAIVPLRTRADRKSHRRLGQTCGVFSCEPRRLASISSYARRKPAITSGSTGGAVPPP